MKPQSILFTLALSLMTIAFLSCDNDDETGIATDEMKEFIESKYPNARIVDVDWENNGTVEVDIIHDNKNKEVVFDKDNNWLYTSWDLRISDLTEAIRDIVKNPDYSGYHIDDADFVETAQEHYYLLELEKGGQEIKVKVDESGKILD